jgi:hypothetical protein
MRKEVNLSDEVISNLQALADKKQWSLKKYMEVSLERQSLKNTKCENKHQNTKTYQDKSLES